MRKLLTLLFMSLFVGTGSVMADNMRAYSTGISDSNTNISYNSETKTWTWSKTTSNQLTIFSFTAGTLSKFSTINWVSSESTVTGDGNNRYRILFYAGNTNLGGIYPVSDGSKSINLSEIQKDGASTGTYLSSGELNTVTAIKISGSNKSSGSTKIDLDGIYLEADHGIGTSDDWNTLSTVVNAGLTKVNVSMTDNVSVTDGTMVGLSWDKSYKGTFDGAGHTLTFNYNTASQSRIAPFKYIEGATIKNLLTSGEISTDNLIAGIAADVKGTNYITCCGSDMTLTAANTSDCRVGGLVARCNETGATINFDYCIYNGAISAGQSGRANGFVGYVGQSITVHYSLLAPTSVTNGGNNFGNYNASSNYDNSYYATKFGTSTQATAATAVQLASGSLAYALNTGNTGILFFGQAKLNAFGAETMPKLTSDASCKVVKLTIKTNSGDKTAYANKEGVLPSPALYNCIGYTTTGTGSNGDQTTDALVKAPDADATLYRHFRRFVLHVTSAGATTLILPINTDVLPTGVKAYKLNYTSGDEVTATPVDKITANKPVLINADEGDYTFLSNVTNHDYGWTWSNIEEKGNGALTGIYEDTYVPADSYVLQKGADDLGFYKVAEANTIKITSFRAYLTAEATTARSLSIVFEDENTTGISDATRLINNEQLINNNVYDLQGRKVAQPKKGLYIVNGKKVVIK